MEMREYIEAIAESCRKLIISKPATKQEEYRKIIVQKKEAFFAQYPPGFGTLLLGLWICNLFAPFL